MSSSLKSVSPFSYLKQNPHHKEFTYIISQKLPSTSHTWEEVLRNHLLNTPAPVYFFKHLPLSDGWDQVKPGLKIETINIDSDLTLQGYWISTIIKVFGYFALIRYDGYEDDSSRDLWINLANPDVHEVGWTSNHCRQLIPPKSIQDKFSDWKNFLMKALVGAKTLPSSYHDKLNCLLECRFKVGQRLEVYDRDDISAMRPAIISEIQGCRLRLQYLRRGREWPRSTNITNLPHPKDIKEDVDPNTEDFWCHANSHNIHPVGWSLVIGHRINADKKYMVESKKFYLNRQEDLCSGGQNIHNTNSYVGFAPFENFCLPKLPKDLLEEENHTNLPAIEVNMKCEALDPLNLSSITVATVIQVLQDGYLMIKLDNAAPDDKQNAFCYHTTSPCIFPPGFAYKYGLELDPPHTEDLNDEEIKKNDDGDKESNINTFSWDKYFSDNPTHKPLPDLYHVLHGSVSKDLLNTINSMNNTNSAKNKDSKTTAMITEERNSENNDDGGESHNKNDSPFITEVIDLQNVTAHLFKSSNTNETMNGIEKSSLQDSTNVQKHITVGMKVEAVDLMEPHLLCVATIAKVIYRPSKLPQEKPEEISNKHLLLPKNNDGEMLTTTVDMVPHLVKVHYDGWDNDYDAWMSANGPDLFAPGWSELAGYKLEAPQNTTTVITASTNSTNKITASKTTKTTEFAKSTTKSHASGGSTAKTTSTKQTLSSGTAKKTRTSGLGSDATLDDGKNGGEKINRNADKSIATKNPVTFTNGDQLLNTKDLENEIERSIKTVNNEHVEDITDDICNASIEPENEITIANSMKNNGKTGGYNRTRDRQQSQSDSDQEVLHSGSALDSENNSTVDDDEDYLNDGGTKNKRKSSRNLPGKNLTSSKHNQRSSSARKSKKKKSS